MGTYFVYILKNSDNKLYIGQTSDLNRRLKDHTRSKAAVFTKKHKGFKLVYFEKFQTLLESRRRENQLKGWTRAKKDALISGNLGLLKEL